MLTEQEKARIREHAQIERIKTLDHEAIISALLSLVDRLQARVAELEARLSPKTCHFENTNERCNESGCAYYTTFTWADCPHGGKHKKYGDAE